MGIGNGKIGRGSRKNALGEVHEVAEAEALGLLEGRGQRSWDEEVSSGGGLGLAGEATGTGPPDLLPCLERLNAPFHPCHSAPQEKELFRRPHLINLPPQSTVPLSKTAGTQSFKDLDCDWPGGVSGS